MQQIKKNYFQLFEIPETFALNLDSLAEKYRTLQSQTHPDRFANASEPEKLQAVQMSSYLNQAYDTLKSPLRRAGYLLELQQCDIEQVSQQDLSMDLLLEQMQLRESLDELPKDESALPQLDALKAQIAHRLDKGQLSFAANFEKGEVTDAKKVYHELQFLYKLLHEIELGEEQRLGY